MGTHAFQISRSTVIPSTPLVVIGACIGACGLTGQVRMSYQGRHIGSLHSGAIAISHSIPYHGYVGEMNISYHPISFQELHAMLPRSNDIKYF